MNTSLSYQDDINTFTGLDKDTTDHLILNTVCINAPDMHKD